MNIINWGQRPISSDKLKEFGIKIEYFEKLKMDKGAFHVDVNENRNVYI